MKTIKTKWFWWWGWNPKKVEDWLEEMEAVGWNLYQVDIWGVRFKFEKDKKQNIRYCVDFQSSIDENYLSILKDDGWKMVWSGAGGWYLWKKNYEERRPEIFTDSHSLIERNNRLFKLLLPFFIMMIVIFMFLLTNIHQVSLFLIGIYIILISFYGFAFYKLKKYNKKLENNIKE